MPATKVLHVIDSLGVGGGAEHSLAQSLPLLAERGIDSTVVTLRPRGFGLETELDSAGFTVYPLTETSFPGWIRGVRRHITQLEPDIVHATLFNSCMVARFACFRQPCRLVNSLVSTSYDPARTAGIETKAWKLKATRLADRVTATMLGDHFHVVGSSVQEEAEQVLHISPSRMTLIPRGRSRTTLGERTNERRSQTRAALSIDSESPIILNVGRQDHAKAQALLIDAFAHVHGLHPDAVLLIAGREGDATTDVQDALRRSGCPGAVRLLGHRADVADLCVAADIFAFPSLYEGAAGSILEAFALGTPVVGSDASALIEVLGGGQRGLIAKRGDSTALASAITRLIEDQCEAKRLAAAGREAFDRYFEIGAVADATASLYRSLVEEK